MYVDMGQRSELKQAWTSRVKLKTFLAKALYDNIAESPDELAFRRGDILTLVEQDTEGLDGWWLCSLRGKSGIAPGNRLKLLTGMHNTSDSLPMTTYQSPKKTMSQVDWNRRSWDYNPNKVVTPRKMGDVYIYSQPNKSINDYDVPPSRYFPNEGKTMDSQGNYTTPQKSTVDNQSTQPSSQSMYDTPPSRSAVIKQNKENLYSVPAPYHNHGSPDTYDTPQSNRSSILSIMSADSTMTMSSSTSTPSLARSSNPPSICDSARSSLDISPQDLYDVPPSDPRAVKQVSTDSGLDMYDSPPKLNMTKAGSFVGEDYDSPKSHIYSAPFSHTYDTINNCSKEHSVDDIYDVPTNNALKIVLESSPEYDEGTLKSSGRKVSSGVYDIPPQVTRDSVISIRSDSSDEGQRLSTCSLGSRDSDVPCYDELPLDLDSAMDLLVKLQQDVQKSTGKLNTFVSSTWRKREKLEPKLYDIKVASADVRTSLEAFVNFAQGTLANSTRVADKTLIKKLYKQLHPLQQCLQQVQNCLKSLEDMKWNLTKLALDSGQYKDDDLGNVASMSKELSGDVRKLASFIQGNSTLLFKRAHDFNQSATTSEQRKSSGKPALKPKPDLAPKPQVPSRQGSNVQHRPLPAPPPRDRPLPPTPPQKVNKKSDIIIKRISTGSKEDLLKGTNHYENDAKDWVEDYDYVHLQSQAPPTKIQHEKPTRDLPEKDTGNDDDLTPKQKAQMAKLEEDLKTPVNTDLSKFILPEPHSGPSKLEPNDQQILSFYSKQLETHATLLTNAIDAFFGSIECNQPPRVFIAHSKYVVLSAHKIVYIGDTLHRNLLNSDVRSKIMHCANYLCDCLKLTVTATKTAALQYPSIQSVQEMVDRVVDVSHASHELKLVIIQAGSL